jgi:hypothetical protein
MHTNNQQHYQQELGENTHKLESKYPNHAHLQLEGIYISMINIIIDDENEETTGGSNSNQYQ